MNSKLRFFRKGEKQVKGLTLFTIALAGSLFAIYSVGLATVKPGKMHVTKDLSATVDCKDSSWTNLPQALFIEGQACPSFAEVIVNLGAVDIDNVPRLSGTLRVWPAGELGEAVVNTGVASRALKVSFESLGETNWRIPAHQFIGSRSFQIPLRNNGAISDYPFDKYKGTWTSEILDFQTNLSIASALTVSSRPIYGWDIEVATKKISNGISLQKTVNLNGKSTFFWNAARSSSVQLSVFLLLAVMILGIGAALILTISIYRRRRPPTLGALGWLATFLFAMIEIRSRFPGSPPLGIKADVFITYPATMTLMALILAHTYMWINRDDWDMKNTPDESFRQ